MSALFVLLLILGIADLTVAAVGDDSHRNLRGVATVAPFPIAGLVVLGLDYQTDGTEIVGFILILGALSASWQWMVRKSTTAGRSKLVLAFLALMTFVVAATSNWWPETDGGPLGRWVEGSPYLPLGVSGTRALAVGSVVVALTETANSTVRLVLRAASVWTSAMGSGSGSIRGGRLIGPIERLMIFALALAGQPTAAALIISAKGLLRYPELKASGSPGEEAALHDLSEYLLVGSLTSWGIALAALPILPA